MPIYKSDVSFTFFLVPLMFLVVSLFLPFDILGVIIAATGLMIAFTMMLTFIRVSYDLRDDCLIVTDDLGRTSIPYADIEDLVPRYGFALEYVSGLSFKRIAVFTKEGLAAQISPRDRDAFMRDICRRCPQLAHISYH